MKQDLSHKLVSRLTWDDLAPEALTHLIELARNEDISGYGLKAAPHQTGDLSSQLLPNSQRHAHAILVAREPLVVCGLPMVPAILNVYGDADTQFNPLSEDGRLCLAGDVLGTLSGPTQVLLSAERVILNFLQMLSGIVSTTRKYVDALANSPTRLLDTRKTTPGYRMLQKIATATGGGFNHRLGLFDRIMLKDNHLAAENAEFGDALKALIEHARKRYPEIIVELEVEELQQIPPALDAGVDVLLFDNFSPSQLREAVSMVGGACATEASGGITLSNIPTLGLLGLDFISTGATIHQSTWKDIALDWQT